MDDNVYIFYEVNPSTLTQKWVKIPSNPTKKGLHPNQTQNPNLL